MRFVPRNCIRSDTILAKPVVGMNGQVLLKDGIVLKPRYIKRLEEIGVSGVYIHDPLTEDIEIVNALSDELKAKAVRSIFATYSHAAQKSHKVRSDAFQILKIAGQIVDEILSHGNIMLNLFDLKTYDSYTFSHCVSVAVLAVVTGAAMGYGRQRLISLAFGSLLHDVGKMFVPAQIVNKDGPLTDEEYATIKKHAKEGYRYLLGNIDVNVSEASAKGVLEHHERFDGSGYPDGKAAARISEFARLIAVTDVYDALVSDRPYRKGVFPSEAVEYIQGGAGSMFDFQIIAAFSKKVAPFPVGMCVQLSNGSIGIVVENFEGFTQRPMVKIIEENGKEVTPYKVDLSSESLDVTIVAVADR